MGGEGVEIETSLGYICYPRTSNPIAIITMVVSFVLFGLLGSVPKNKKYRKDKRKLINYLTPQCAVVNLCYRRVPFSAWDNDSIDHWKIEEFKPGDMASSLLEESSFATLFPKYREKYLQQVWPHVTRTLKDHVKF